MARKLKPKTSRKELKSRKEKWMEGGKEYTSHEWKMPFLELLQQEGFYERIIDYYTQHPSLLNTFPYMVVGSANNFEQVGRYHDDKLKKGHFYLGYRPEPSDTYGKPSGKGMYYIVYINPTNEPDEIGILDDVVTSPFRHRRIQPIPKQFFNRRKNKRKTSSDP